MNAATAKHRIVWAAGSVVALGTSFLLFRYTFFGLHGMKQWPFILLILGEIVVIISSFFNATGTMIGANVGYIMGFVAGMLFGVDGVDQGGGATNNAWQIWTVVFLICIAIGVVADIIAALRHPLK